MVKELLSHYPYLKEQALHGRYLHLGHVEPLLKKYAATFTMETLGYSVEGRPIHGLTFGNGPIRVLAWSQMHGNESTTTKAVFDLLRTVFRLEEHPIIAGILSSCQIKILPVLNPDGALAYSRKNARGVDLNRDAQMKGEPESRVLRAVFDQFQPAFCLNLHDQRTIFSAGEVAEPAVLSFLTPAMDEDRQIFPERSLSMQLIVNIFKDLEPLLPGKIGRYDDAFNIQCTGDTFQSLKVPTVLFEAGQCPGDYSREKVRKYVFAALVSALSSIATKSYLQQEPQDYERIPENGKGFNDIIIREVGLEKGNVDIAIQYREELRGGVLEFLPVIENIDPVIDKKGHREIHVRGQKVHFPGVQGLRENVVVHKMHLNKDIFLF